MATARDSTPQPKPEKSKGFVRTLIASLAVHTKETTKMWTPFFWLLAGLSIATFVLEIIGGVPALWYVFLIVVAGATVALDIIKLREHAKGD